VRNAFADLARLIPAQKTGPRLFLVFQNDFDRCGILVYYEPRYIWKTSWEPQDNGSEFHITIHPIAEKKDEGSFLGCHDEICAGESPVGLHFRLQEFKQSSCL